MVRLQKQVATTFCNISVELFPPEKLEHVHPLVKEMFQGELKQNVPLGGGFPISRNLGKSSQKIGKV